MISKPTRAAVGVATRESRRGGVRADPEGVDGNVTTPDFVALAERESGHDLGNFFDVWLYRPGKPTSG